MTAIDQLRNLGPKSAQWLHEAGIVTVEQLKKLGPVVAYRIVKNVQPKTSLNLLWALAAGLQDQHWQELTANDKLRLKQQLAELDA